MNRRSFLEGGLAAILAAWLAPWLHSEQQPEPEPEPEPEQDRITIKEGGEYLLSFWMKPRQAGAVLRLKDRGGHHVVQQWQDGALVGSYIDEESEDLPFSAILKMPFTNQA